MDTTNHIERHWKWIKYIILNAKINLSIRDLIVPLVGSATDGPQVEGPILLNHFKQKQAINKLFF